MNPHCEVVAPIFLEYRETLTRFIKSRVKDPLDSEELTSEVMLKIYNYCEKLDDVKNIEAWLIAIAKNTISDYLKEQNKRVYENRDQNAGIEEADELYQELEACIPSLIEKLPAKYAEPLIAYELKGVSQKELAARFGISESGLKSRVQRGRKMLKALFIEHCGHLVKQDGCSNCDDDC